MPLAFPRARRWVFWRLVLRVRADFGLREVGTFGLERDGIFAVANGGYWLGVFVQ